MPNSFVLEVIKYITFINSNLVAMQNVLLMNFNSSRQRISFGNKSKQIILSAVNYSNDRMIVLEKINIGYNGTDFRDNNISAKFTMATYKKPRYLKQNLDKFFDRLEYVLNAARELNVDSLSFTTPESKDYCDLGMAMRFCDALMNKGLVIAYNNGEVKKHDEYLNRFSADLSSLQFIK